MKTKRVTKIIISVLLILLAAVVLFVSGTFIFHRIKSNEEAALLKEKGYYNPVSVGDYCLNVAKFGK